MADTERSNPLEAVDFYIDSVILADADQVEAGEGCLGCGERRVDDLVFDEAGVWITCQTCGQAYSLDYLDPRVVDAPSQTYQIIKSHS